MNRSSFCIVCQRILKAALRNNPSMVRSLSFFLSQLLRQRRNRWRGKGGSFRTRPSRSLVGVIATRAVKHSDLNLPPRFARHFCSICSRRAGNSFESIAYSSEESYGNPKRGSVTHSDNRLNYPPDSCSERASPTGNRNYPYPE